MLTAGRSYVVDIADSELEALDRATFSANPAPLGDADIVVLCLPTPLADGAPDLSMVRAAADGRRALPAARHAGRPGVHDLARHHRGAPAADPGGRRAWWPARLRPRLLPRAHRPGPDRQHQIRGHAEDRERAHRALPRARGLVLRADRALDRGDDLDAARGRDGQADREHLPPGEHRARQRARGDGHATSGVDIWEALHAAATKPFGYQAFWPGPGVGGHCIAIDPTYLSWRAGQQLGYRVGFIEHANEVNNRMPDYVVTRVAEALNRAGKPVNGSTVLGHRRRVQAGGRRPARVTLARRCSSGSRRKGAVISYHDSFVRPMCDRRGRTGLLAAGRRDDRRAGPGRDLDAASRTWTSTRWSTPRRWCSTPEGSRQGWIRRTWSGCSA